jgi:hypothetical protein
VAGQRGRSLRTKKRGATIVIPTSTVGYLRFLDAQADGADWTEVSRLVLDIDPAHLARAKWVTERGYRLIQVKARAAADNY